MAGELTEDEADAAEEAVADAAAVAVAEAVEEAEVTQAGADPRRIATTRDDSRPVRTCVGCGRRAPRTSSSGSGRWTAC